MSPVWFIVLLVLIFVVVAALTSPWRTRDRAGAVSHEAHDDRERDAAAEVLDLEAARDAKYREIRDCELDRQTGKLAERDFALVNTGLRAEAVEILRRLDRAQARLERIRRLEAEKRVLAGTDLDPRAGGPPSREPADAPDPEPVRSRTDRG